MFSHIPVYNLMVVLKETGLKADVLRAWERRYGLPHPQRSSGGHRLYSEYDIATVKWLQGRQAEGLSISRAAVLWNDLIAAGREPLDERPAVKDLPAPSLLSPAGTPIEILRQKWLEGCLVFDTLEAEDALNQAFALFPVEQACDAILRQGLQIIGDQWYLGRVSPQQEHFASALAVRRLNTLISATPQPTRSQSILVGCPPGERHTFPALLLSLYLLRRGLKVVFLGEDIPLEQMDEAIATIHPDLIVLAAQQLVTAASLASMAVSLQERGIPHGYGGLIFNHLPDLRKRISGLFLGESLDLALVNIENLLHSKASSPSAYPADIQSLELASRFRQERPAIDYALIEKIRMDGLQIKWVASVNSYLGDRLVAALELGDLAFLENDLDWIQGFLTSLSKQDDLLPYLTAYGQCIANKLAQEGYPLTGWIEQYASRRRSTKH